MVILLFCIILSVLFSAHPVLILISLLSLYISFKLFWRKDEPKIIFFGLILWWLSVTIKIFYADLGGFDYESLSISKNIVFTTYISLLGFNIFSIGLWVAIKNLKINEEKILDLYNKPINFRMVIFVYLIVSALYTSLKSFVFHFPGFAQLFAGFLQMKLGFLFMIIFYSFRTKKYINLVLIIILFEVFLSFFSYFASFKDIIFTALIAASIFPVKFSLKRIVILSGLLFALGYLIFTWQAVKEEYRKYLSGGERAQKIVVTRREAINKLLELSVRLNDVNNDKIRKIVFYRTIDRLSYIEFFSQAIDNVPIKIPYENGELWLRNITHIFTPRILFPKKESIDDSKMVNKYATIKVSTSKQGGSFSLGFMAESYIDFGPVLMFIPIFFVGWLLGFIYKMIIVQSINYLWAYTMVLPLWVNIFCNGTPGSKILGWIIMYYIAFIIVKFTLMKPIDKYITV